MQEIVIILFPSVQDKMRKTGSRNFLLIILFSFQATNFQVFGREIKLGAFHSFSPGLSSAEVTLLDTKRILIRDFYYDGSASGAWFQIQQRVQDDSSLNTLPAERDDLTRNLKIPDENGSCKPLKSYLGRDLILTLPAEFTFSNVDFISLYCYVCKYNFGYISIPSPNLLNGLREFTTEITTPSFCNGQPPNLGNYSSRMRISVFIPAIFMLLSVELVHF